MEIHKQSAESMDSEDSHHIQAIQSILRDSSSLSSQAPPESVKPNRKRIYTASRRKKRSVVESTIRQSRRTLFLPPHSAANLPSHDECQNLEDQQAAGDFGDVQRLEVEDPTQIYVAALNDGPHHVHHFRKCLILRDFDPQHGCLRQGYVILLPLQRTFSDGQQRVFVCCECSIHTRLLLESTSENVNSTYDDFKATIGYCLHSRTAEKLPSCAETYEDYDDEESPAAEIVFSDVSLVDTAVYHIPSATYAVVRANSRRCLACSCQQGCACNRDGICKHLRPIVETLPNEGAGHATAHKMRCLSNTPIGKSVTLRHREVFRDPTIIAAVPTCQCDVANRSDPTRKPVVTESFVGIVEVVSCNCGAAYDGGEDGLLHMNAFLIGHDALRFFERLFISAKSTLVGFYVAWIAKLKEVNGQATTLTYKNFKDSWFAYLSLLDISMEAGFRCPVCLDSPDAMLCDGTAVSFRVSLSSWGVGFAETEGDDSTPSGVEALSTRKYIITSCEARQLLRKLLKSDHCQLSDTEYTRLIEILDNDEACVGNFVKFVTTQSTQDTWTCHPKYRAVCCDLTTTYPACSLLPATGSSAELIAMLESEGDVRANPQLLSRVQKVYPALHALLGQTEGVDILPVLLPVLRHILKVSNGIFNVSDGDCQQACGTHRVTVAHFPVLPQYRGRPQFVADKNPSREDTSCLKTAPRQQILLAGIFTIYCRHGICYGFEVMRKSEGENVPFNIMYTRFKKAPSLVVYDNACNLERYALRRAPAHFRETKFVIDRFHWPNHTACPSSYNMIRFPDMDNINSQINEQTNAGLKRIKASVSFMGQDAFMAQCSFFLYSQNERKKASLVIPPRP